MAWTTKPNFVLPPAEVGKTIELVGPLTVWPIKSSDSVALHNQVLGRITRSNKVPTHDPYTNPNAHIYYECSCGAILDPGTKSFAALNNCAMNSGWKVRFKHDGYKPYCVDCGKDVE